MTGWQTLLYKEVLRFWKVAFQTVGAPVLTSVLYMLIFGHVLEDHVKVYDSVAYTAFLLPGLMMMGVLQNAFANSSSSLVQSKIMGSLVFLLLTPPVSPQLVCGLCGLFGRARVGCGCGRVCHHGLDGQHHLRQPVLDLGLCRHGCGFDGRFGGDCRAVG